MNALENLRQEVEETQSAIDSAIVFIAGLANRLREALMGDTTSEDISELADELDAAQTKLATAIAANTNADEDSDDNYDPTPIGADFEPETVEFAGLDESEQNDGDTSTDTPTAEPNNADDTESADENGQTAA